MIHLEQARPEQLQALAAFAGRAFRTRQGPEDFAALLPKLYAPGAGSAPMHTVLYRDGNAVGLYCLQVQEFHAAGLPLRVGCVGTVCVDSGSRGNGYLALLMQDAASRMEAAGCTLGMLGGQRQRYERFGYAPSGSQWVFTISPRNVRGLPAGGVTLAPLPQKAVWLPQANALYRRQPVLCDRGPDRRFYAVLQSWRSRPLAILHRGRFAGYCTLAPGRPPCLLELVLPDPALLPGFAAALIQMAGGTVKLQLYPWQQAELTCFAALAEQSICVPNHSYRVLDWLAAARAGLALRGGRAVPRLAKPFVLQVEGAARLCFAQTGQGLEVRAAAGQEVPDLTLPPLDAARLLFGPDSMLVPGAEAVPAGLLPLPLAFPWADGI